jgi:DegV family protein with EDD domain
MEELMSYYIFADVSIDIDKDYAAEHDIHYVPMEYVLGEDTFHCEAPESDSMMHEYYEKLRNKIATHTSQITPNHYIEVFEEYVKEGKEIVYLSLSSGLSNTYESALMAVKLLEEDYDEVKIEVVDSLGATGGMGVMVELAVNNREAGMNYKENAQWLREHADNINYWFKVEDLMYLKRGGRVSAATAIMGTALNIKPILTIDKNGKLQTIDKKRGNKLALKAMVERFNANYDPSVLKTVYLSCADCTEDADMLKALIEECRPEAEVKITMLSPIIGAHTGPDMLSLIYYGGTREF